MTADQLQTLQEAEYSYNPWNQLTEVETDTGAIVQYKYNGDGLLYERTENGVTTRSYNDGADIIAEGIVSGGTVSFKARYIRGLALAARQDGQQTAYYLHNGHGDVVKLRDSSGNTRLNSYDYDIWGKPLSVQETVLNPFRYSGEYWDDTTGLQYLRARWYYPIIGRFITEDAYEGDYANPLSMNRYTYVHNNPLRYVDPSGNAAETVIDILSIGWSAYDLWRDPSWVNAGFLAWDIAYQAPTLAKVQKCY